MTTGASGSSPATASVCNGSRNVVIAVPSSNLGLPQGICEAIRRRIETLSIETRQVLSVASVIGREFGLKFLEKVSGLGTDRLLEAMREAESYEIVEQGSMVLGDYSFSHVLVRDTFYYESPPARRIELQNKP